MKNTPEIRRAILAFMDARGCTRAALAKHLSVAASTVGDWANGNAKEIRPTNWTSLRELIHEYLPPEYHFNSAADMDDVAREIHEADGFSIPESAPRRRVPVVGLAQAAGFEPALEPIAEFLLTAADESIAFEGARANDFVVRIEGDSMADCFPHGTLVLVAGGEYPSRGDLVVAKLHTGQIVCKEYQRRNSVVMLNSSTEQGENFEIDLKEHPGGVVWMFPVLEAKINVRKLRREQRRHRPRA